MGESKTSSRNEDSVELEGWPPRSRDALTYSENKRTDHPTCTVYSERAKNERMNDRTHANVNANMRTCEHRTAITTNNEQEKQEIQEHKQEQEEKNRRQQHKYTCRLF